MWSCLNPRRYVNDCLILYIDGWRSNKWRRACSETSRRWPQIQLEMEAQSRDRANFIASGSKVGQARLSDCSGCYMVYVLREIRSNGTNIVCVTIVAQQKQQQQPQPGTAKLGTWYWNWYRNRTESGTQLGLASDIYSYLQMNALSGSQASQSQSSVHI